MKKTKVAIIGTGNIGADLLFKMIRSPYLDLVLFSGRNLESSGIKIAKSLGIPVSDRGIQALIDRANDYDIVFDATNSFDHATHWRLLRELGKRVIDLTPSKIGQPFVPAIDGVPSNDVGNISLISCGGR